MITTTGVWNVKSGREDEFQRRWQQSADGLVLEYPDVSFRLMRDRDEPRRFVSVAEGWRNVEQIEAARSSPTYQDSLASVWRVLESGEVWTLDLVAEVS